MQCECSGSVLQPDLVNWTATYRSDSTIVTPYEKWVYYDDTVKARTQQINYAAGKTKKVAIFVSNCGARSVYQLKVLKPSVDGIYITYLTKSLSIILKSFQFH